MIFFHPPGIIIVIPQYEAWHFISYHVLDSFIWGKTLFKFKTLNLFSNSNLLMMMRSRHPRSSSLGQLGSHKQIPKSSKIPFLHDLMKICSVIKIYSHKVKENPFGLGLFFKKWVWWTWESCQSFFASLSLCEALKKEKALVSRGSNSHQINY
jgi:hypothetical protein